MLSALTYFFDHSIYFARLHHVNPLCKHKCAFLQMKEALNQKVQEKKPLLKFKNTKKYICLERIWKKSFRHRPLLPGSNKNLKQFFISFLGLQAKGCRKREISHLFLLLLLGIYSANSSVGAKYLRFLRQNVST